MPKNQFRTAWEWFSALFQVESQNEFTIAGCGISLQVCCESAVLPFSHRRRSRPSEPVDGHRVAARDSIPGLGFASKARST